MVSGGLTYRQKKFFAGFDVNFYSRYIVNDGGTYISTDGYWETTGGKEVFHRTYSDRLPSWAVVDIQGGYNVELGAFKGSLTAQVFNIFDKEYIAAAAGSNVTPGLGRTFRINLSAGL
jgi:outer membrane receptor protein involved in Fe transport